MPFLIRKINKAKWHQVDIENDDDVSADAITMDLKTSGNTLSAWYIISENEIEDAILALVSGQDHLEMFDIVMLSEQFLQDSSIKIIDTPGATPIQSLVNTHRNLAELTFLFNVN